MDTSYPIRESMKAFLWIQATLLENPWRPSRGYKLSYSIHNKQEKESMEVFSWIQTSIDSFLAYYELNRVACIHEKLLPWILFLAYCELNRRACIHEIQASMDSIPCLLRIE